MHVLFNIAVLERYPVLYVLYSALCNQDVTLSCVTEQPFYVTRILCPQAFSNIVYIFNQDGTMSCVTEQSIYVIRKRCAQEFNNMSTYVTRMELYPVLKSSSSK
jgi:hypothetical protein